MKQRKVTIELSEDGKRRAEEERERKMAEMSSKLAHSTAMLRKANTRVQRAMTIRRRWARKVAYYSRKLQGGGA